ncbi:MAG TPA: PhoH family protein [Syntrophorhabdales bacterium]|nr:PhoH family protein [Syntrophorhabdales bacterium]
MTRKTYILDTNVLVHDPESIFRFHENEVVVPYEALEELDRLKERYDYIGHNARQTLRYLGGLIERRGQGDLCTMDDGGTLKIDSTLLQQEEGSVLAFGPALEFGRKTDNRIIGLAWLYKQRQNGNTVFVSKDMNARIKAHALGIRTEDYGSDESDAPAIYSGHVAISADRGCVDELHRTGELPLEMLESSGQALLDNQCVLITAPNGLSALAINKSGRLKRLSHSNTVLWGVKARNKEQQFAVELLLDSAIHAVSLVGQAGTGKTLLALAVGLHKTLEEGCYARIIITKPVIPVGKQNIGFLPGDKKDKMLPWVQSIFDNVSPLSKNHQKMTLDYLIAADLLEIESIAHVRGRSLARSWIIVEEAQNLTPHEIKTLVSRVGEGSKIVLTGDIHQIDSPHMDALSNGLTHLVNRFKGQSIYGHVTLRKTIRSTLAALAAELL